MIRKTFTLLVAIAVCCGLATSSQADLTNYSQDFESLLLEDNSSGDDDAALLDDGWLIFGNVFDGGGGFIYNYGVFGAPNGENAFGNPGTGFSAVNSGEQGAGQGTQYLNAFNDYRNADHTNNPSFTIESLLFQEQVIMAGDVGATWNFGFDYKAAAASGPSGPSTAKAFLKVLDPTNGFAEMFNVEFDTTGASTIDWNNQTLSLDVTQQMADVNGIVQFGFGNTAQNFSPTGVLYDNVSFVNAIPEPASAGVLAVLFGAVGLYRRRK